MPTPIPERIKDFSVLASAPNSDDYIPLDGVTGSTRKILADRAFVPVGKTIHVEKWGNDSTANGSPARPFVTVQAAYALIAANADASITNKYIVEVGPGVFSGATLGILPWTWLVGRTPGMTTRNGYSTGVGAVASGATLLDFEVGYASVFATAGSVHCGIQNIGLAGGHLFNFSLNDIGGPDGSITHIVNCFAYNIPNGAGGGFVWHGRGEADMLNINGLRGPTETHVVDGTIFISNANLTSGLSFGHSTANSFTRVNLVNCYIEGVSVMQGNTSDANNSLFVTVNTAFVNGWIQTEKGLLTTDVASYPKASLRTTAVGFTTTFLNDAFGLAYESTTPANWAGTAPKTVQEALDRLAAVAVLPP